ncbi:hypothetical protein MMC26_006172 [Xylographa opegraphella]|nr:hypothetical protein [Xylographa opegraphella]
MAVQTSPQHMQSSVASDPYSIEAPSSRRHYAQHTSQPSDVYLPASSPPSSRRPSRRPSGNTAQISSPISPQQAQYQSPKGAQSQNATTGRSQPMTPNDYPTTGNTISATSPPSASSRREQRGDQDQSSGPPIPPPPRTSSNHRSATTTAPINVAMPSRTVASHQSGRYGDEQGSSPRFAEKQRFGDRGNIDDVQTNEDPWSGSDHIQDDPTTTAPTAARSRRRNPTSPEAPQRSASTREPRPVQLPANVQSRSVANIGLDTPLVKVSRDGNEVIKRMVIDDPQVDLSRARERLAEVMPSSPAMNSPAISSLGGGGGNEGGDDGSRNAGRSRQDHSASTARRKETKFGDYVLGQTLGEGEFGKVKLGWKKDGSVSSVQVAIKLIRRENLNTNPTRLPKIYREIKILSQLSHKNIVRLHEMVETDKYIGIILEYASGGELFDYILTHRYLKDNAARKLFAQLVSGVGYLHKKGIVHRDLKLENLLLDRNRNIIITDFGFANTFNPRDELGEEIEYNLTNRDFVKKMDLERLNNDGFRRGDLMQTSCGSPCYAAPELVVTDSLYTGRKVDVWSCGVILYAMLAGYLPFDDDPANPEGDNINLLYKYIMSTPLTFPEYVTPHARDLLRRILVPDPRKRADLFEVARHSWLSEYAHVVVHVTSSTTTIGDIQNTTVTSDNQEAPLLARSASVREPTKPTVSNVSPVGGLSHQGKIDPEKAEKSKTPRDPKRRTVQVEYVAPQSQTVRGELSPPPPPQPGALGPPLPAQFQERNRSSGPASTESARKTSQVSAARKPLPQDPPVSPDLRGFQESQVGSNLRTNQRPATSQPVMQPPARPIRDPPRSVSDSINAFGQLPTSSATRPTTGGSMVSTGAGRLPSRGSSYSQVLGPTVVATNAQGKLAQPKNGRSYNISAPIPQAEPYISDPSIGVSSAQPVPSRYSQTPPARDDAKSHKRSNTLTNMFAKSGSFFSGKSQTQLAPESTRPQTEKRYPPTSMKGPIASNSPRQSTDSRRPSFSFSRKNSDPAKADKPRRFSLLPASFSLKSMTAGAKDQNSDSSRPMSQRQQSYGQQPQSTGYDRGASQTDSEESIPAYDGVSNGSRNVSAPLSRRTDPSIRGTRNAEPLQQPPYLSPQYESSQISSQSRPAPPGQSFFINETGAPTESELSVGQSPNQPRYPAGFNSYDEEPRRSMQGRNGRGPAVLQKPNRKFADAYEHDPGHHAGSSGAAKRVMDFFRRRGRSRAGEDR